MNTKMAMLMAVATITYRQAAEEAMGDDAAATDQAVQSLLGMEDLDSMDFDTGIEAAPGFVIPPAGSYRIFLDSAKIQPYKSKDGPKRRIMHIYKIQKVLELADPTEKAPPEGSIFSERWTLTSEGLSYWKTKALALMNKTESGGMKVVEVIEALNTGGYTFNGKVSLKVTKGDDGKEYTNINVQVVSVDPDPELPADNGL